LIVWWKTDPAGVATGAQAVFSPDALAPWGIGPAGASVEFGSAPFSLRRQVVPGGLDHALQALQRNCRNALISSSAAPPPISESERRLLSQLSRLDPLESDLQSDWSIYRLRGPLAMVLGVGRGGDADDDSPRVLCWGLAFPAAEDAWTVLTVEPRMAESSTATNQIELPASAVRLLAVSDELGGGLVTFSGEGPPAAWKSHFDDEARRGDWSPQRAWRSEADAWAAAWEDEARRIDVQFHRADGGWTGLIHISPVRDKGTHP
jgi:hypothetical protein